jgi:hypothetical protein
MAKDSEHRMVFDIRGRRKRVVQVAYTILAVLMVLSLFTVVGPVSFGDVFGGGSGGNASDVSLDRAEDLERQLAKDPQNETLLLQLVRERITAGNNLVQFDETTGQPLPTAESQAQYEEAADAWARYLQATSEPNPNTAQLAANALFTLASTSTTAAEADASYEQAAEAQRIVAEARPSLGTLSTLAYYSYAALQFEQGDRAAKQAVAEASSKSEAKSIETQLADIRKQAKRFEKQQLASAGGEGQAEEQLGNPLGGLAGGGSGLGAPAPAP